MEQLRLPPELVGDMVRPVHVDARAEIVRLQAAGYGNTAIARQLNAQGVPTPSGRGQWWDATVRRHASHVARLRWNAYIRDYRNRQR